MKPSFLKTVAVATLIAGAAGGVANATEGWYGRADVGYSVDGEIDFDVAPGTVGFDEDWVESLGLGYAAGHWRFEGELAHRFNRFDEGDIDDGDAHAWSALANVYYDFNPDGWFQPYVGVGAGVAHVNANGYDNGGFFQFDSSDTAFAWQALAGAAFALTDRLDLDVGYRYFNVPELDFPGTTPDSVEAEYTHQAVTVGLRWQFAAAEAPPPPPPVAPPPPPPPPVATCPQSDFVVYFEWDRSNLNAQALEVIDSAVARARECNVSSAVVVGHTDTSGSPAYNEGLSQRRASVVADALVARGLSSSLITAEARGETDLARATRDGVREPLNRRTAVTIRFQ